MSKVIRISDEVHSYLKNQAKKRGFSFVSPDNILRAIFGLKQAGRKQAK